MRAMLHSHCQGSAESYLASTSLIRSSTLLHLGLINLSISHTWRNKDDSRSFILPLKNCCIAKWSMMNTCKYSESIYLRSSLRISRTTQHLIWNYLNNSGYLEDKKKPIIFSMARLDTVKNLTGLTEWYGKNKRLRGLVNLVIVGGFFDPNKSKDREEMAEITKMHGLIKKYRLNGQFRWIAAQTDRNRNGELYRCIADTNGAFVQPALYEAFGLTVIEAMNCGLPTFATNQGGPAEIIVDGISGFHIDPQNGDESSNIIADFFEKCKVDPGYWNKFAAEGLKRINEW